MKKSILLFLCSFMFATGLYAQSPDCASCHEKLANALNKDALLRQYNNEGGQVAAYKAAARTYDMTLQICGHCLSSVDKNAMQQALAQMKQMVSDLGSSVPTFKWDDNYQPYTPPVNNAPYNNTTTPPKNNSGTMVSGRAD